MSNTAQPIELAEGLILEANDETYKLAGQLINAGYFTVQRFRDRCGWQQDTHPGPHRFSVGLLKEDVVLIVYIPNGYGGMADFVFGLPKTAFTTEFFSIVTEAAISQG